MIDEPAAMEICSRGHDSKTTPVLTDLSRGPLPGHRVLVLERIEPKRRAARAASIRPWAALTTIFAPEGILGRIESLARCPVTYDAVDRQPRRPYEVLSAIDVAGMSAQPSTHLCTAFALVTMSEGMCARVDWCASRERPFDGADGRPELAEGRGERVEPLRRMQTLTPWP